MKIRDANIPENIKIRDENNQIVGNAVKMNAVALLTNCIAAKIYGISVQLLPLPQPAGTTSQPDDIESVQQPSRPQPAGTPSQPGTARLVLDYLKHSRSQFLRQFSSLAWEEYKLPIANNTSSEGIEEGCNLFEGKWVFDDESYPLYKEESCP
ncbi:Trichome birefringence-like, N-terminal domain [Dillenia turbinata]|uniref:Trichome birefringence-like, N-terminal domain n=1 Tax=Dillenia turbinata TaxID=194707 RepID=A0AAN8ZBI0_9MAGN